VRVLSFFLLSTCVACLLPVDGFAQNAADQAKDKQIVLISFDGTRDNALWDKSRDMAAKSTAKFTYFLSCAYLMQRTDAQTLYDPPQKRKGTSNIGFATSQSEITTRLNHIWQARAEGHEMGNHACGHFDGKSWTANHWNAEFDQFRDIVSGAWMRNGVGAQEPEGWQDFAANDLKGFRAPYLSTGKGLFKGLEDNGFDYDASTVSNGPQMPDLSEKVVKFALPLIPEGPSSRRIIAMDYNLYVRHSKAEEMPEKSVQFEARTLAAFNAAFDKQYNGKRIPLQIGFHFVEMNAGAYWRALETFVIDVCTKPDVDCITYQEALLRMKKGRQTAPQSVKSSF
jgi:hypothetical protein